MKERHWSRICEGLRERLAIHEGAAGDKVFLRWLGESKAYMKGPHEMRLIAHLENEVRRSIEKMRRERMRVRSFHRSKGIRFTCSDIEFLRSMRISPGEDPGKSGR
jgi:hypothetical protein